LTHFLSRGEIDFTLENTGLRKKQFHDAQNIMPFLRANVKSFTLVFAGVFPIFNKKTTATSV
jgi:hypothetical protein